MIMAGYILRLNMGSCTLHCRPIILLESNTGYPRIHQLLEKAGDRSKARAKLPCSAFAATAVPSAALVSGSSTLHTRIQIHARPWPSRTTNACYRARC